MLISVVVAEELEDFVVAARGVQAVSSLAFALGVSDNATRTADDDSECPIFGRGKPLRFQLDFLSIFFRQGFRTCPVCLFESRCRGFEHRWPTAKLQSEAKEALLPLGNVLPIALCCVYRMLPSTVEGRPGFSSPSYQSQPLTTFSLLLL